MINSFNHDIKVTSMSLKNIPFRFEMREINREIKYAKKMKNDKLLRISTLKKKYLKRKIKKYFKKLEEEKALKAYKKRMAYEKHLKKRNYARNINNHIDKKHFHRNFSGFKDIFLKFFGK